MPDVVFVCQHGGAKSLIAAEHFNRIASDHGLDVRAACAGLEPYREVPAPVVSGLAGQGIDVSRYTPQQATSETFAGAGLVVHFGCDVTPQVGAGVTVADWGDVPAVSDGFDRAHDVIVQRVERLVETMVKSPQRR